MRLSEREVQIIKEAVSRWFGPGSRVYLFGSRVDDQRRGGDIDLFVKTDLSPQDANRAKLQAITDIQLALGDQKIDMVASPFVHDGELLEREIHREAVPL